MPIHSRTAFSVLLSIFTCFCLFAPQVKGDDRPNIILMMSDDMGFSDIGCYGGEIQTPVLDQLAASGVRFTQFYNTGRCCPTRASLLTGLYPHQAGIGHMMNYKKGMPGYQGQLNRECRTIAEVLRPAGYRTYLSGKWHVTPYKAYKPGDDIDKANWPLQRGFDRFYGTIHGAGSFFDPNSLTRDNQYISPAADPLYKPETYYYTDAISDHAVKFINDHHVNTGEQPFFLYVAYTAAHWPMHALPEDIKKYEGKYDEGFEAIRKARYERMLKMGLIDPKWQMAPGVMTWESVEHKAWDLKNMEVYAAMVDRMDQGIGKIIEALKGTGEYENTLVMFFQDNGGCAEGLGRKPRNGHPGIKPDKPLAPMTATEFQVDMIPKKTRDGWPLGMGPGYMPGPADTYIAYGEGWANVSNTPFREYKHWVHEGGVATPLVVHWPKGIDKSRHGQFERQPSHLIDLMATCIDLGKAKYPAEVDGQKIIPVEGVSLAPGFAGKDLNRGKPIYFEHEGNCALRDGKWKIVKKRNKPWELYDMEADRSELNNLAESNPEKLKAMAKQWEAFATGQGRFKPWPWDAKKKSKKPVKKKKK